MTVGRRPLKGDDFPIEDELAWSTVRNAATTLG
jgi:hypothetical protein